MDYRYVVFDFDGVLAETNEIRFWGFTELFRDIPAEALARFMGFVKANGGLSRYGKIRHLYESILGQAIADDAVNALAGQYSRLVAERVVAAEAVPGSLEFLAGHADRFDFAVISGSDQDELRQVCKARGIDGYFQAILGSPKEKSENIEGLLATQAWDCQACVFVGDSLNDRNAAVKAGMSFIGRDSGLVNWKDRDEVWISDLHGLAAAIEELSRRRERGDEPQDRRSIA
jgi:phosphoglycolate phosphatase-like HAD superfamily hydrolase